MFGPFPDWCRNTKMDVGRGPPPYPSCGSTQPSVTHPRLHFWFLPQSCDFSDCLMHVRTFVQVQCGLCPGWWKANWVIPACSVKPGIKMRGWHSRQSVASAHLTVLPAKKPCLGWGEWPCVQLSSPISCRENQWRMTLFWSLFSSAACSKQLIHKCVQINTVHTSYINIVL